MEEFLKNDLKIFLTAMTVSINNGPLVNTGLDPRLTLIDMTLMSKNLPSEYNKFLINIRAKNQATINTEFEKNRKSFEIIYKKQKWLFSAYNEIIFHYLNNLDSTDYDHLCSSFSLKGHRICLYINFRKKQIFLYDPGEITLDELYKYFFKNISDEEFKIYFYNGKQIQDNFCVSYTYFFMSNILKSMSEDKEITIPLLYSLIDSSENGQRVSLCKNYLYEIYDRLFVKDQSVYEISFRNQKLNRNDFWDLDIIPIDSKISSVYNSCFYRNKIKLTRTLSVKEAFENVYSNLYLLNDNSKFLRNEKGLNILTESLLKYNIDNFTTRFDILTYKLLNLLKLPKKKYGNFDIDIENFNCRNDESIERNFSALKTQKFHSQFSTSIYRELNRLLIADKGVNYYFSFKGSNWPDIEEANELKTKFIKLKNEKEVEKVKEKEELNLDYTLKTDSVDFNCGLEEQMSEERLIDKLNDYHNFFEEDFYSSRFEEDSVRMNFIRYNFLKKNSEILDYVFYKFSQLSTKTPNSKFNRLVLSGFHGISLEKIVNLHNLVFKTYRNHLNS